jgi:hypothetical protein
MFVLALFLVFGLFLIKSNKEKTKIAISLIFVPLLSSFWLFDFIKNVGILNYAPSYRLYSHPTEVIYSILIPLVFLGIIYFYKKIKKTDKKEFLFYVPLIFISFLYISNLFLYIPILKSIEPRTYGILLTLISIILILDLKPNKKALRIMSIGILILSLIIAVIVLVKYNKIDFPIYSEQEIGALNLIPLVKEEFIAIGKNGDINKRHIYAYGAVKYNTTTPLGWGIQQASEKIKNIEKDTKESINNKDCESFIKILEELKVKEVIAHEDKCNFLESCNLNKKEESGQYCLLSIIS